MSVRDQLQQNPAIVAVAAMVIIVGSVVWMARGDRDTGPSNQVYFYDLETGDLFPGARDADPPIDAPSGVNNGVRASVFSCDACREENLQVAFLTTYSEQAQAAIAEKAAMPEGQFDAQTEQAIEQGMLVAAPPEGEGEPRWVPAMTPQGIAVTRRTEELCGDQPAKPCLP